MPSSQRENSSQTSNLDIVTLPSGASNRVGRPRRIEPWACRRPVLPWCTCSSSWIGCGRSSWARCRIPQSCRSGRNGRVRASLPDYTRRCTRIAVILHSHTVVAYLTPRYSGSLLNSIRPPWVHATLNTQPPPHTLVHCLLKLELFHLSLGM